MFIQNTTRNPTGRQATGTKLISGGGGVERPGNESCSGFEISGLAFTCWVIISLP
jgi:hypothetical protein